MKKLFLTTLCILTLVGCSSTKKEEEAVIISEETANTQIATPFHEVTSLSEATKDAGFNFNIPEEINGSSQCSYLVYDSDMNMIDVRYGTSKNVTAYVRKCEGTTENLSGDYNAYDETKTVIINDTDVTLKSSEDAIYVAEWSKDGYSYSLKVVQGLSEAEITEVISNID